MNVHFSTSKYPKHNRNLQETIAIESLPIRNDRQKGGIPLCRSVLEGLGVVVREAVASFSVDI